MSHDHALDMHDDTPASQPRLRTAGLSAATVTARSGDGYEVRSLDGEIVTAQLARGVTAELADECLRDGRIVLVSLHAETPLFLGALQTTASAVTRCDGVVTVQGREVRLEAERRVQLEAGSSRLSLSEGGKLQLWGERLTMHVASLIKMIASKVELP